MFEYYRKSGCKFVLGHKSDFMNFLLCYDMENSIQIKLYVTFRIRFILSKFHLNNRKHANLE